MEKVTARIAVSPPARRVQVEHLGGDAVEIPNGVDVGVLRPGPRLPGCPRPGHRRIRRPVQRTAQGHAGVAGRAAPARPERPDLRLLVIGRGDADALRRAAGPVADRIDVLGAGRRPDEGGRAALGGRVLRPEHRRRELRDGADRGDGGRGAGAGQRPRRVPCGAGTGPGCCSRPATPPRWPRQLAALLADPGRRAALRAAGRARAAAFDWPVVAAAVLRVYRAAVAADPRQVAGSS